MFLAASHSLAKQVSEYDLERGCIYPSLSRIREVSAKIAFEVATIAFETGLADREMPADLMAEIRAHMYQPIYPHYG